eukprot:4568480-Alexandrium_andersonii.AAC.1
MRNVNDLTAVKRYGDFSSFLPGVFRRGCSPQASPSYLAAGVHWSHWSPPPESRGTFRSFAG